MTRDELIEAAAREIDPEAFQARLAHFARGRCSAIRELRGKTLEEALKRGARWFPRIAGETFAPSAPDGFLSRSEAIADAHRIKADCIRALAPKVEG